MRKGTGPCGPPSNRSSRQKFSFQNECILRVELCSSDLLPGLWVTVVSDDGLWDVWGIHLSHDLLNGDVLKAGDSKTILMGRREGGHGQDCIGRCCFGKCKQSPHRLLTLSRHFVAAIQTAVTSAASLNTLMMCTELHVQKMYYMLQLWTTVVGFPRCAD